MLTLVETSNPLADEPRSQASLAYTRIRADILAGRRAPDEKLKIADLAAVLAVSPGAIREALSRLVPEQLVVSRDQRGFVVAPLSIEDLEDLTDLRCELEAIALRRSVARGDTNWEASVLAAAHRLRRTLMATSAEDRSLSPQWVGPTRGLPRGARRRLWQPTAPDAPRPALPAERALPRPVHSRVRPTVTCSPSTRR